MFSFSQMNPYVLVWSKRIRPCRCSLSMWQCVVLCVCVRWWGVGEVVGGVWGLWAVYIIGSNWICI